MPGNWLSSGSRGPSIQGTSEEHIVAHLPNSDDEQRGLVVGQLREVQEGRSGDGGDPYTSTTPVICSLACTIGQISPDYACVPGSMQAAVQDEPRLPYDWKLSRVHTCVRVRVRPYKGDPRMHEQWAYSCVHSR